MFRPDASEASPPPQARCRFDDDESPDDYAEALKRADTLNGLPSKERVRRHPRCLCEKAAAIIALRQIDCVYESLFGGLTKVDDSDSGFQFERRNYTLPGQREYVVSRPFVRMVVPDSHVGQVRTVSVPSDRLKMHVRNVGNPGEIPEAVSVGVQLDKQVWVKETEIELAGVAEPEEFNTWANRVKTDELPAQ